MNAKITAVALAMAGLALAPSVDAAQVTSDFQVKLIVQPSCKFNTDSIGDLNLGSHATNATNVEGTTEVRVQCTKGSVATVKLVSTDWKLKDTAGDAISYRLYGSDNQEWNNINGRSYTGGGAEQLFQIKGKVDNVGDKSGTFQDTVTVSVEF
ncbi:MAG TPA: spore coat protein U domain-containing protein [Burkholderiaceae bacterium]|nr:spore coat protein U domain-containing protein [Burkholderiaceae bacterium]